MVWQFRRAMSYVLAVLLTSGCGQSAPRNSTLPSHVLVADFAKADPNVNYYVSHSTFGGSPATGSFSKAWISSVDNEGLHLGYRTEGKLNTNAHCGLAIKIDPAARMKDWSAVAFEVKLPNGDPEIKNLRGEAKFVSSPTSWKGFDVKPGGWQVRIIPIVWGQSGHATETESFKELVFVLSTGTTNPSEGTIIFRRVYLLKSETDLPEDLTH